MSAIAGLLCLGPGSVESEPAERMVSPLAWRGPDDDGSYRSPDGRVALAAHRLAVMDRSDAASMPMANETHDVWMVLDGEIINHRPLRHSLELVGHRFRSNSDAEVALHAYEQWGMDFLRHLQGSFALALWDDRRDRLVLARDKLGRKPLYLARHRGKLAFASAMEPVLAVLGLPRYLDPTGLMLHLSLGFVPAPHALAAGLSKLAPGEVLIGERGVEPRRSLWGSCEPDDRRAISVRGLPSETHVGNLRTLLECSIADRLMGDGPVGVALRPGAEWGALATMMSRLTGRPSVTVAAIDDDAPDGEAAREIRHMAGAARTELHEVRVSAESALACMRPLTGALAEPVTDENALAGWFTARAGAESGLFALLGADGADEVLLGHPAYQDMRRSSLRRHLRRLLPARMLRLLQTTRREPSARASVMPGGLIPFGDDIWPGLLGPDIRLPSMVLDHPPTPQWTDNDELEAVGLMDLHWRVAESVTARADSTAQAHGIEARLPFLDDALVTYALAVPGLLRSPSGSPRQIMRRCLTGFAPGIQIGRTIQPPPLPLDCWMAGALGSLLAEHLSRSPLVKSGLLAAEPVRAMLARHRAEGGMARPLWALLVLLAWAETHGFTELAPAATEVPAAAIL